MPTNDNVPSRVGRPASLSTRTATRTGSPARRRTGASSSPTAASCSKDLADAGAIDAPTPRAWVDAFDADAAGIATDLLAGSLFDQLADAMEAAQ